MPVRNQFVNDPSGTHSPTALRVVGPVVPIEVHVPPQIAGFLASQGQPIPTPSAGMALIDTGASITCVHEPILQQLALSPISVAQFGTAKGPVQQSIYPARIVFPSWGMTIDFQAVAGADLSGQTVQIDPPQPLICLVGRNVLAGLVFIYNGPGGFWTIAGG